MPPGAPEHRRQRLGHPPLRHLGHRAPTAGTLRPRRPGPRCATHRPPPATTSSVHPLFRRPSRARLLGHRPLLRGWSGSTGPTATAETRVGTRRDLPLGTRESAPGARTLPRVVEEGACASSPGSGRRPPGACASSSSECSLPSRAPPPRGPLPRHLPCPRLNPEISSFPTCLPHPRPVDPPEGLSSVARPPRCAGLPFRSSRDRSGPASEVSLQGSGPARPRHTRRRGGSRGHSDRRRKRKGRASTTTTGREPRQ